jgi:hypothetical protein
MAPDTTGKRDQGPVRPADRPPAVAVPAEAAPWQPALDRLGLGSSAGLVTDLVRPVAWLGAQLLLILQPTLTLFGAGPSIDRLAHYLEDLDSRRSGAPGEEELC